MGPGEVSNDPNSVIRRVYLTTHGTLAEHTWVISGFFLVPFSLYTLLCTGPETALRLIHMVLCAWDTIVIQNVMAHATLS